MRRSGFTIVELVVSTAIAVIAVTMTVRGYVYLLRQTHLQDTQDVLDVDVQVALEHIKYNMRLSSLDRMFFHPQGAATYTAISFPMAADSDGDGVVDKGDDDKIIWGQTVVYHVWNTAPHQLRCTRFTPRDNTLSHAQRQDQLVSVVTNGHGQNTLNGSNAVTDVVFENLFTWSLDPRGAIIDAYAPEQDRDASALLGSILLDGGPHTFRFELIGKNPLSTGYKVGVDSLCVSPSASVREGEAQLPVTQQSGATAVWDEIPGGRWSGNHQLLFPAGAVGHFFELSMQNDLWRETHFQSTGDSHHNTRPVYDESLSPHDFVVTLDGPGTNWSAAAQMGVSNALPTTANLIEGAAFRVLLRGDEMIEGGWIDASGRRCRVGFATGQGSQVRLQCAYIGEASSAESNTMDVASGTQRPLTFGGATQVNLPVASETWSDLLDMPIDRERSYLVSYLVSATPAGGRLIGWDTASLSGPNTYMIPAAGSPTIADTAAETWTSRGDTVAYRALIGVSHLYATCAPTGIYESAVFDTHVSTPAYQEIWWDASAPTGTDIGIKVRTGANPDMSDAPAWTNVIFIPSFGVIDPGNKRYVQFLAQLTSDAAGANAPRLKEFLIRWAGVEQVVDVTGTFTRGPDYGIYQVTVDGQELMTGINVDLEIFDTIRAHGEEHRLVSQASAEVEPRNTGL
jgi:type II secretory pathway pseudopilin PulG